MGASNRTFSWLTVVAAGAAIAGCLGPWAKVSVFIASAAVQGTDTDDGKLFLAGGGLALVFALIAATRQRGQGWPLACLGLSALILLGTGFGAFHDLHNLQTKLDGAPSGAFVQISWGIYLTMIGGFMGAATGVGEIFRQGRMAHAAEYE